MSDIPQPSASVPTSAKDDVKAVAWFALLIAVVALVGSLFLSMGMHLKACPLCFYQRTFAMSLVAVLAIGLVFGATAPSRLLLLSLPLAVGGLGVAAFHVFLEASGKLECPSGVLGFGSAPQQSLVAFVVLLAAVFLGAWKGHSPRVGIASGVVLGLVLAGASCVSNPPMPPVPTQPYAVPPEICRPPFRAP